jgi:hypothetical protein
MTDETEKSPEEVVRVFKKKQELRRNIFVGIAIGIICVWAYNSGTSSQNSSLISVPAEADLSWVPTDFNSWNDDPNVAWRWLNNKEYECTGDSCWGMMIIAKNGCKSNLYAELSILDKSDVQVGYTNDSVSSALPMQKSKLVFNSYEDSAHSARISKISCY